MSDCFDHALDAYESMEQCYHYGASAPPPRYRRQWNKRCYQCGEWGLRWHKKLDGSYQLYEKNNKPHKCAPYSGDAESEFTTVKLGD